MDSKKTQNYQITNSVILFFIACSLSIFNAINYSSFVHIYKKIAFGTMIYFSTLFVINQVGFYNFIKKIIFAICIGVAFQCINQIIFLITKNIILAGTENTIKVTIAHFSLNGKLYDNALLEATYPFLFYNYFRENKFEKWLNIILISTITILAFFSLFRYRLFASIVAFILFFIFEKRYRPQFIKLIMVITILLLFAISINGPSIKNTFSRIDDVDTITWRLNVNSTLLQEIPAKYIPFGVGLGNIYDYVNWYQKKSNNPVQKNALESGPHNLFTQFYFDTGIIGVSSLLLIILIVVRTFIRSLYQENRHFNEGYLAFFLLILIAQVNPSYSFQFFFLFFFLLAEISSYSSSHHYIKGD